MRPHGLLVQLSDPHIKAPGQRAHGRVDTAAALRAAIDSVLALPQAPAAVVVTGDLTDSGRAEEYRHLRILLSPLRCPCYLLPGNHDDRATLRRMFSDHDYLHTGPVRVEAARPVHYAVDLGGLRLVAIDTLLPGEPGGALCDERLAALDATLAAAPQQPTVLAMHHPPFATGIGHMDEIGLANADALAAVVARHAQVERVICGHLHRPILRRWAGTIAMTAPSTAHQVAFDLAPDAACAFMLEPPGALVHAWDLQGQVLSHQIALGHHAGPYPFHEDGQLIA
jgi:3',5'-cyclic-AMP phosphodiesterase